jgi:hypothetical protein
LRCRVPHARCRRRRSRRDGLKSNTQACRDALAQSGTQVQAAARQIDQAEQQQDSRGVAQQHKDPEEENDRSALAG